MKRRSQEKGRAGQRKDLGEFGRKGKGKRKGSDPWVWAGLAAATLSGGCRPELTPEEWWENSPGARGIVNLDAVGEAFLKEPRLPEFEKRVNEIYEGDHLVLFHAYPGKDSGVGLMAREDLNGNGVYEESDDPLFILHALGRQVVLQGLGGNQYYSNQWARPLPPQTYSVGKASELDTRTWAAGNTRVGYYTPVAGIPILESIRRNYRHGPEFPVQVRQNIEFEGAMDRRYGAGFRKSIQGLSTARDQYMQTRRADKTYLTQGEVTGWQVRYNLSPQLTQEAASARAATSGGGGGFGRWFDTGTPLSGFRVG